MNIAHALVAGVLFGAATLACSDCSSDRSPEYWQCTGDDLSCEEGNLDCVHCPTSCVDEGNACYEWTCVDGVLQHFLMDPTCLCSGERYTPSDGGTCAPCDDLEMAGDGVHWCCVRGVQYCADSGFDDAAGDASGDQHASDGAIVGDAPTDVTSDASADVAADAPAD